MTGWKFFSGRGWLLGVAWLVLALWLIHFRGVFQDLVAGPVVLDPRSDRLWEDLADGQEHYVTLRARESYESKVLPRISPYRYSSSKRPYAWYVALPVVGDKMLLACSPDEHTSPELTGILEPLSAYEQEYLLPRLRERLPDSPFLPYRLNGVRSLPPLSFLLSVFPIFCLALVVFWKTSWLLWKPQPKIVISDRRLPVP